MPPLKTPVDNPTAARRWSTALTYIEPNKILVRGYPLDEMMGRLQFGEAIYLLLTGELPTPSIGRLMDAMLVSFIDHGATPPSTLAHGTRRRPASSLRGAVAAGVLGFGRYHGGDALACRQLLDEGLALARTGKSLAEVATVRSIGWSRPDEIPPPGFGHRYHTIDPRATRLLQIAHELEVDHEHAQLIRAIEHALTRHPALTDGRCRSTSTAPSRPSAATSACRRRSPTRCSSSRACPALRRTRSKNRRASRRCARSIPRRTPTTGPRSDGCRSGGNEPHQRLTEPPLVKPVNRPQRPFRHASFSMRARRILSL